MNRKGGNPFFATGDKRRVPVMVIDKMGEMIGRKSIGLVDDNILIVFRQFPVSADFIMCLNMVEVISLGFETDDIGLAFLDEFDVFGNRKMTATCIFAVVSRNDFVGFLYFTELIKFFLCAEAGISTSFLD